MTVEVSHQKRALRAELRERRRNMTATEREHATETICSHLRDLVTAYDARTISAYLSSNDEPNIRPFLNWAQEQGLRVLFPVSRDDGLLDWTIGDGETEQEGLFGMPEPVGELLSPSALDGVDLIIVPAASVDRQGMRMGWGRGYFDRTLGSMEKCPPVYAVIFDRELVDSVPTEVHDRGVDGVVTPSAIVDF
ncbi:5-formyltetrahydrofolate cyclo-ligase [Lacisediminihabitans changchengi]|uniref:5-formyltetrahydrofolate cyclo-ligase n=1 Tax=Lacisediminihabitans changchengi TaxID=2787634 RepID=A0A934W3F2_9MICO|nr:5-formyltetrahydrofolate cyclo-ligase [Lacisediminihabitans changchengi]MBK4347149.1 5-formyltetrahydrofolate cyclo-ligase [Lacisediminihabitans changchengi]